MDRHDEDDQRILKKGRTQMKKKYRAARNVLIAGTGLILGTVGFIACGYPMMKEEAVSGVCGLPDVVTIMQLGVKPDALAETESTEDEEELESYAQQCELPYVATPVNYSMEEAILRIEELSEEFPEMLEIAERQKEDKSTYPYGLVKSLANNPEMLDFVQGYLQSDGSVTGGITEQEIEEEYPLFLQWDTRWGYYPYGKNGNIGTSGCGPTCLAMAIHYLTGETEATPDVIAAYSIEKGYYVADVGTAWALLNEYPTLYGLTVSNPSLSEENLKKHLDNGEVLICSVRPGDFTAGGHFIVIYGYEGDEFKINDPKCVYRSRRTWTYEEIKDDIKRTWAIAG